MLVVYAVRQILYCSVYECYYYSKVTNPKRKPSLGVSRLLIFHSSGMCLWKGEHFSCNSLSLLLKAEAIQLA